MLVTFLEETEMESETEVELPDLDSGTWRFNKLELSLLDKWYLLLLLLV